MEEKFSWKKYLEILNYPQQKHIRISSLKSTAYVNEFIPNQVFKYFSFPKNKTDKKHRLNDLIQGKLWFSRYKNLNDPYDLSMVKTDLLPTNAARNFSEVKRTREVVCFTDSAKNKLMWAHYGNSFTGYCVEFTQSSKIGIRPVEYIGNKVDFTKEYSAFYDAKETIYNNGYDLDEASLTLIENINPIFCFKDKCWEYENEMRIVAFPANPDKENSHGGLHNLDEYRLSVSRIICGSNCDKENIEELKKVCKKIYLKKKKKQLNVIIKCLNENSEYLENARIGNPKVTLNEMAEYFFEEQYSKGLKVPLFQIVAKDNLELIEVEIELN